MAFAGSNANAVLTAAGTLETMPAFAFVAGFVHKWSKQVVTDLSYAYGWLDAFARSERRPPVTDPVSWSGQRKNWIGSPRTRSARTRARSGGNGC